jgi:chitodextrinase
MKLVSLLLLALLPLACIAGTWTDLGSGTLFSSTCIPNAGSCGAAPCTSSNYAFTAMCQNKLDAWSGGDLYSNGSKFFLWGGGHADYYGNEVVSANLLSKTIANIYPPSCFNYSGSGTTPCAAYVKPSPTTPGFDTLPDGSPQARHTYGSIVCVDRHSTCYQFSGAPEAGVVARYMWEWPMSGTAATNWTQTTQFSTTAGSPNTISCADYPTADALYCVIGSTGPQSLYSYSYSSHTWTPIVPNGFNGSVGPFAATMVIDNTRNIAVFAGNSQDAPTSTGGMGWVDLTGTDGWVYHDVTSTANASCRGLMLGAYPGLAFDPNDKMIVGKAQEGSTVYVLNPQTWTCSTDNPSGAPANATASRGLFGRWRYSAALNGFVTLNEWNQNVFVYTRSYGPPDNTPPSVPTGLTASASTTSVALSWTASTDPDDAVGYYTVYRNGSSVGSPTSPTLTDTGLAPNTLYTYTVSATDTHGNTSSQSTPKSATTSPDTAPPTLPTGLTATAASSSVINLAWTPSTDDVGVAGYGIYRGGTQVATSPTASYSDTGLSPSTLYTYTVSAYDAAGNVSGQSAAASATTQASSSGATSSGGINGLGHSTTTCIDRDGDGYGTGPGCAGPDADDLDPTVHTAAQALAKWGMLKTFLAHLGYSPNNFWYISTTGTDNTNCHDTDAASQLSNPCASYYYIQTHGLAAGDMVIWRGGTYSENLGVLPLGSGSAGAPLMFMAYPGEVPNVGYGLNFVDQSWTIVDGLKMVGPNGGDCLDGGSDNSTAAGATQYHDNIYRHLDASHCLSGFAAFNGLVNITIEDSVFHDNNGLGSGAHGLYIGSRGAVSSNVTVRRVLCYNNDVNGMQFNGRVTNLIVEQNMFHSNLSSGLTFENGVSHSFVRSNLFFNNASAGFNMAIYDYDGQSNCVPITGANCNCNNANEPYCPYDENYNLIENNSFYSGGIDRAGAFSGYGPVTINQQDYSFPRDVGHNTFRNNIFSGGPDSLHTSIFQYWNNDTTLGGGPETTPTAELAWWATNTFDHNVMYALPSASTTNVASFFDRHGSAYTTYTCSTMAGITTFPNSTATDCKNVNPQYTAASPTYYNSPSSFNLAPAAGSPAIGAGSSVGAPLTDVWGSTRPSPPSIGAVEPGGGVSGVPVVSSLACSPTFLGANETSNCTVTLNQAAPTGGATVGLSTNTASLTTPQAVVVAAGSPTATFPAAAGTISNNGPAIVTTTLNGSSQTASVTLLGCDLNGDGVVNNLDVQIAVNQALGISPCGTADLRQNSQCSVVDVQRVANAASGRACRIGQ